MGKVVEKVRMWNVWDEEKVTGGTAPSLEVEVLVDTGATQVLLPRDLVKKLGLRPHGRTRVRYADGRVAERDVAIGLRVEIAGRDTETRVIVEDEGVRPLLGQIVLEDTDLLVDCRAGKVIPNPASPDMPMLEEL
ncbi:MAG: clan AA aspartic protease [Deltaproteobacteria bacterium]|nr:clan AA aspartic protease [Deltaproteobacteria bacterium]